MLFKIAIYNTLILLTFLNTSFGNYKNNHSFKSDTTLKKGKLMVKLSPLGIFEPNSIIWISPEIKFNSVLSLNQDLGYVIGDYWNVPDHVNPVFPNFSYRLELRRYISFKKNNKYIASQILYKQIHYRWGHNICNNWIKDTVQYPLCHWHCSDSERNNYFFKKYVFGISGIFGIQNYFFNVFVYEFYVGIGLKYKHITTTNKEEGIPHPDPNRCDQGSEQGLMGLIYDQTNSEIGGFYPNISAGFRIGFIFK